MKFLEFFNLLEETAFSHQLTKYKTTFTEDALNTELTDLEKLKSSKFQIPKMRFTSIIKKNTIEFKNFILSENKLLKPTKCKAFKKIINIDKLLTKLSSNPSYIQIQEETKKLLSSIDTRGLEYYCIVKNKQNSPFKDLPCEIIGKIFYYVDGDINFDYQV